MAFPYWSDTMRRIEAIWTHVPPDYDPTKGYQVFMYYKCGGGIHNKNGKAAGGYRPTVEEHEHPFQLDSAAPSISLRDFALKEARFFIEEFEDSRPESRLVGGFLPGGGLLHFSTPIFSAQ